jgi:5-methylcytosine-specific restriction endonuclease McrA
VEEVSGGQRRADALALLAEAALAGDLDRGSAGDRYQVMVHVDAAHQVQVFAAAPNRQAGADEDQQAVVEVGDCPVDVSAETSRRLTCDASVVVMRHDEKGVVLDVGRKTRTTPPAIRRALTARDTRCQFPGCTARRCDAHHVVHWADGGATALDNLMLLCRRHHRLLHEGGYTVGRDVEGALKFVRPNGYPLEFVPAPPRWVASAAPLAPTSDRLVAAGIEIGPHTAPLWDGTPFNVGVVIDALRGSEPLESGRQN